MKIDLPLLIIGGVVAYALLKNNASASSGVSSGGGSGWSQNNISTPSPKTQSTATNNGFHTTQLNEAIAGTNLYNATLTSPIYSSTGNVIATDIYKGRASINEAAHVSNLIKNNAGATILSTDNPLEKQVVYGITTASAASGNTSSSTKSVYSWTSSRRPANETERQAAKAANIKALGGVRDSRTGELIGA